jgi:hypothetical protein
MLTNDTEKFIKKSKTIMHVVKKLNKTIMQVVKKSIVTHNVFENLQNV